MLVQEYLKNKEYLRGKDKAKNDMMYQDIYKCICQNTKKRRYTLHYVKPTAQLLFKNRFPKGGPRSRDKNILGGEGL